MSEQKKDNWFSELNPYVKLAAIIVACIIAYIVIKKLYDQYEKNKLQKTLENSTVNTTIQGANGVTIPVSVNLGTKASAIYAKFYDNDWFGMSEDEQGAITELLDVPKNLIPNLSATYFTAFGKNLKQDFQKYCAAEWSTISYLFS